MLLTHERVWAMVVVVVVNVSVVLDLFMIVAAVVVAVFFVVKTVLVVFRYRCGNGIMAVVARAALGAHDCG